MTKFFFVLLSFFSITATLACTPGAGNGPAGDPNCMGAILSTDPYYNNRNGSNNSAQPTKIIRYTEVEVPPKYGALALNKKTGIGGGAINMNSKAEAKKEAIKRCENDGSNAPCKVIIWVKNGCFATATNSKNVVFTAAEERGQAEKVAMNRCKAARVSGCRIADHEACSIPDISKY